MFLTLDYFHENSFKNCMQGIQICNPRNYVNWVLINSAKLTEGLFTHNISNTGGAGLFYRCIPY